MDLLLALSIIVILLFFLLIFGRPGSEKEEGKKGASGKVKAKKALTTVWAVIVFIVSGIGLIFLTSLSLILDR